MVRGSYEIVVHGIWVALDVHPNSMVLKVDVANASNTILYKVI
jgi:hypothetical protein